MLNINKPSLYDLFELHATARGKVVKCEEEADTVLSINKGIIPFDMDTIMNEYL